MRVLAFLAMLVFPVVAEDAPLKVELLSEVKSAKAGEMFWVGLHLKHAPGAHTYWKHPGIVGLATTVEWELPPGFKAGEMIWPAPQRVQMAGHGAQGYEGETLLMVPITPTEGFSGKSAMLVAKVSWMCCGKTCHPATKVPFSITLPVGGAPVTGAGNGALFEKFRKQVPVADAGRTTAKRDGGTIVLTVATKQGGLVSDPAAIRFFTADGQVNTDADQEVRISRDGEVVMTLARSETGPEDAESLPGVVVVTDGESTSSFEVNPKY